MSFGTRVHSLQKFSFCNKKGKRMLQGQGNGLLGFFFSLKLSQKAKGACI